jgi:hypothetical protein
MPAQKWKLPEGLSVIDNGPRTYQFTVDYNTANAMGETIQRQRVVGEYTRGLPHGEVAWKNVTVADANGPSGPFSAPKKRTFMDGFRYRHDADTMNPGFFKGFPSTAVKERNLVWDTAMIERFGQKYFGDLKLNEPYHFAANKTVAMPDVGTFHNRDIVLEWVGRSRRNGSDCALIQYRAFLNPLEITNSGMSLHGQSDYWGLIWVSLATKQIEYATLHEVVVAKIKLTGQEKPRVVNVFRNGTFEPVSTNK